jgi:hypothetical protein
MSQRALEHAATSPSRFANLLMKTEDDIQPFATRLLNTRSGDDAELEDCCLVPGGRFLVTRSVYGAINLWDLGFTSEGVIKPFPVASMNDALVQIVTTQPTGDCGGIRLVLLSTSSLYVLSWLLSSDDANNIKGLTGSRSAFSRFIPCLLLLRSK